jgi:hypothetical protein
VNAVSTGAGDRGRFTLGTLEARRVADDKPKSADADEERTDGKYDAYIERVLDVLDLF